MRSSLLARTSLFAIVSAAALVACSPTPAPPAAAASAAAPPAPVPAAPPSAPVPARLMSQPPPGNYAAQGHLPAPWEARVVGGQLTLTAPDLPAQPLATQLRAFAGGLEFEGDGPAGRVILSLTSENPCNDPPAYAATLMVGRTVFKGCATGLP